MHLVTGRTLDGILFLDGRIRESLRIHRKASVDHFPRSRALDQYAIHTTLYSTRTDESLANKGPPSRFSPSLRLTSSLRASSRAGRRSLPARTSRRAAC